MTNNAENQIEREQNHLMSDYITSAMDLEDKILESSYINYLDRKSWPAAIDNQSFISITRYLKLLIEETKMHQQIFLNLQNGTDA